MKPGGVVQKLGVLTPTEGVWETPWIRGQVECRRREYRGWGLRSVPSPVGGVWRGDVLVFSDGLA